MCAPSLRIVTVFGLLALGVLAGGADEGNCLPEPLDVLCESNADCPSGQVCNVIQRCVDAWVTIDTDADWFDAGERVGFSVDPQGLDIEIGGDGGVPPWSIERWSLLEDRWVPLRTGTLFGCRTTGCASGEPVQLCLDPGPPWCSEHDAVFEDSWDGTRWVTTEEPCGDDTIRIDHRVPASPGNYRVVYHYGLDPRPGTTAQGCAAPTEQVTAIFGIR